MATTFRSDKFTATTTQTLLYSDFQTNLTVHPEIHDVVVNKNENAVKTALSNLLKTNKYERPFQPNFGSNLQKYLFEPIGPVTTSSIQKDITDTITNFEPRVRLINVSVTPYVDNNAYQVTIQFYIVNSSQPSTLSTILYRVQ
jgi:phage baseplate assembly protein W